MSHPVKGVDHVFILVNELDDSARRYAALGFTLSPKGIHSAAKGSANYTIMFPHDYFELLGIVNRTPQNAHRLEALERMGEGLHAVACRIDDAEAAAASLGDLGIATEGLGSFQRPVPLPDGSQGIAAFSTVAFTRDEVPFGAVFMCQHRTRETVWVPELLNHANTACGLDAILAISDAPADDGARFARLWAKGRVVDGDGAVSLETGPDSAPLVLMTPEAFAGTYPAIDGAQLPKGAYAGLRIRVGDMDAAKTCLESAGIDSVATARGVAVSPSDACGALIEFVPS